MSVDFLTHETWTTALMQFVSLCIVIREGNASKDGHAGTLLQSLHSRPRQKEEFENSRGYLVRLSQETATTAKLPFEDPDFPFPEMTFVSSLPSVECPDSSQNCSVQGSAYL